jgi:hypothetical protein
MSTMYKSSPHIADEDPASNRQRAPYDHARRNAAVSGVPVARKATDQAMPRANVGASMGADDAAKFEAQKAAYYRHNNASAQLRDRENAKHTVNAFDQLVGPGWGKHIMNWVSANRHDFDPTMLALLNHIGGVQSAHQARAKEYAAGKTPRDPTPTRQDHSKAHPLYKNAGLGDTPAAPAPGRLMNKATKLYKGAR